MLYFLYWVFCWQQIEQRYAPILQWVKHGNKATTTVPRLIKGATTTATTATTANTDTATTAAAANTIKPTTTTTTTTTTNTTATTIHRSATLRVLHHPRSLPDVTFWSEVRRGQSRT